MKIKRTPTYRMHVYKDWRKVRKAYARVVTRKSRDGVEYETSRGHTRRTPQAAKIAARKTRYRREPKDTKSRQNHALRRGMRRRFVRKNTITPATIRRVREALARMKEAQNESLPQGH